MPLYEYRCQTCGEFEVWRSLSEYDQPMFCPGCTVVAVKLISAPNINLNSGSFSQIARSQNSEPRLVKQKYQESTKPRYQATSSKNRPWMVSHAPSRF